MGNQGEKDTKNPILWQKRSCLAFRFLQHARYYVFADEATVRDIALRLSLIKIPEVERAKRCAVKFHLCRRRGFRRLFLVIIQLGEAVGASIVNGFGSFLHV